MKTWKITLRDGKEKTVGAWGGTVTQTGELLFRKTDGEMGHVFANGTWIECEQIFRDDKESSHAK